MTSSSDSKSLSYDSFVIIAEDECKMDFIVDIEESPQDKQWKIGSKFSTNFGALGLWECTGLTSKIRYNNPKKNVSLQCEKAKLGQLPGGIHVELFLYWRKSNAEEYKLSGDPERHELNTKFCYWSKDLQSDCCSIRLTIRILKERVLFPDLTQANLIGYLVPGDVQMRVRDKIFYINRRVISGVSTVFDRIISDAMMTKNDGSISSAMVELKTEQTDPAVFHDFLLMISYPKGDVLPNAKNVKKLMNLGRFYDVGWVIELCANHLQLCHEMPKLERMLLAKEYGNRDLHMSVMNEMISMDECKQLFVGFFDRT